MAWKTASGRDPLLFAVSLAVLALCAGMLLSVNLFASVTADSLLYLNHSRDFSQFGWVQNGTRLFGYPLFLAAIRQVSDLIGAEPLLSTAFVQRLLLIVAGALAWRQWRWFSVPFLALLFSAQTLAFTNFLLNEGLAMPLAALMTVPTWIALRAMSDDDGQVSQARVLTMVALVSLGALTLYVCRFTLAGFVTLPLVLVLAAWRTPLRSRVVAIGVGFTVLVAGGSAVMSAENLDEYNTFRPSFDANASSYYYTWRHVFSSDENQQDLKLQRFWDNGSLAHFLAESHLEAGNDRQLRARMRAEEVADMLAAAQINPIGSQIASFVFGLAGGRVDDVDVAVQRIVAADRETIDRSIYLNRYATEEQGREAFARDYNEGREPEVVITDPLGLKLSWLDSHLLVRVLLPFSLLVGIVALFSKRRRFMALAVLAPAVVQAAGLGLIRADNFRFLIATAVFAIGAATSLVYDYLTTRARAEGMSSSLS